MKDQKCLCSKSLLAKNKTRQIDGKTLNKLIVRKIKNKVTVRKIGSVSMIKNIETGSESGIKRKKGSTIMKTNDGRENVKDQEIESEKEKLKDEVEKGKDEIEIEKSRGKESTNDVRANDSVIDNVS